MRGDRKLEAWLRAASLRSNEEVNRAVLQDLLGQWEGPVESHSIKPSFGRRMMNSRASRVTAAVIVLVLVLTGMFQFGNGTQGVALGAVLDAMYEMPWVHIKTTIHRADQIQIREEWECFNPKVHVWKDPAGVINFRDYSQGTAYVYQPANQTVTISATTERFNQRGPESPSEAVRGMIARFETEGSQVTREKTMRGQIPVEVIVMKDEHQEITMVLDLDRQVPLSMDVVARIPETGEEVTAVIEFDYPTQGPLDIYSLGLPADVQVIDNRPKGRVQDLINEIQDRYDAGYGDHIAVLLDSRVGDDSELKPSKIVVMRQQGESKRVDRYTAWNFTGTKSDWPTLYPLISQVWPNLTIEEAVSLEDTKYAVYQMIYDGSQSTQRTNFSGQVRIVSKQVDMFQMGSIESLVRYAWCSPSALMVSGANRQIRCEILPDDPNRPGWVGFRLVASMHDAEKRLPGTTVQQRITDYWFDPAQDYLLMERRSVAQSDEGSSTAIDRTQETAQTSTGQWYPTLIRTEFTYPNPRGGMTNLRQEWRILLDSEPVFTEDVFDKSTLGE